MATLGAAAIMGGSSLLGGITSGKGAEKAAKIQAQSYQQGINEQRNEFNTVQTNNAPYMEAGNTALQQINRLLGLGDVTTYGKPDQGALSVQQQADALNGIKNGPLYQNEMASGIDALTQQQAASGGVRGGNAVLGSSTFGSNLFNQLYDQSIGQLGSLVGVGQSAASGTNGAALSTGDQISSLLGKQGQAQGAVAAAPYAMFGQALSGLGSAYGNYLGGGSGGSGSLFGQPDEVWDANYGWNKQGW